MFHKAILLCFSPNDPTVMVLQLCDGIGVARLLNATMVLPKFEVAAYWNESRYAD